MDEIIQEEYDELSQIIDLTIHENLTTEEAIQYCDEFCLFKLKKYLQDKLDSYQKSS